MAKRKTILESTNEPLELPDVDPDDFEITVRGNPEVEIPSARPAARHTMAAPQANARQTMAAPVANVRQTIAALPPDLSRTTADPPAGARRTLAESAPTTPRREAMPYRSVNRPPTGLLIAFDDGSFDSGEQWRLRQPRSIIGRTSGDIVIPHDIDMSGEHAEISCNEKDGGYEWRLRDLKSTNGTFLRAQRFVLRNGKEVLLGGRRYAFRNPGVVGEVPTAEGEQNARTTQPYQPPPANVAAVLSARLVELTADGEGREFLLGDVPSFFGSDPSRCNNAAPDDPFLDAEHVRFFKDKRGRWVIEDRNSMNGLWVRIERVSLDRSSEFQLGGQRFRFRIP